MSDRKCVRFFYDAFENGIESLDARYKGRCQEISFDFVCSPSDMQWKDPELKVTLPEYYVSRLERKILHSGSRSDHSCNHALGHSLGSWSWGVNRSGLETEVIVKEKCKDLIQCQKI